MTKNNCSKSDLTVALKTRRRPGFKAGSDLSDKVNRVEVEFNEELTEAAEIVELKIQLSSESCDSAGIVEA